MQVSRTSVGAVATAIGLAVTSASGANAAILLDDFSADQTVADAAIGPIPTTNTVGNRTFTVDNRAAVAPFDASLTSGGVSDTLKFSNQTGVNGIATIDYVLGGADLSSGARFLLDMLSFDLADKMAEVTVAVNGVASSRSVGDEDVGTLAFGFGSFAGVDFSNVTTLSITLDALDAPSLDASFDDFRVAAVPAPAAGLLMIGGLGALGLFRRRRA